MNLRGDITPAFSNTGTGPGEKSALQRALEGILFNSASGIVESTADDAGMVASLAGALADPIRSGEQAGRSVRQALPAISQGVSSFVSQPPSEMLSSAGALGNAALKAIQQGVEERGIGGVASATDFVPAGMLAGALPLLADVGKVAKMADNLTPNQRRLRELAEGAENPGALERGRLEGQLGKASGEPEKLEQVREAYRSLREQRAAGSITPDEFKQKQTELRDTFAAINERVKANQANDFQHLLRSDRLTALDNLDPVELARLDRAVQQGFDLDAYHGTKGDIQSFDPGLLGATTGAPSARVGFFFAAEPETAATYARSANLAQLNEPLYDKIIGERDVLQRELRDVRDQMTYVDEDVDDGALLDALSKKEDALSKEIEDLTVGMNDAGQNVLPVKLRLQNPLVHDFGGGSYREVSYRELLDQAQREGKDGAIFRNTRDGGPVTDIYVVFEPSQIRSRFAAFDPDRIEPIDPRGANSLRGRIKSFEDNLSKLDRAVKTHPDPDLLQVEIDGNKKIIEKLKGDLAAMGATAERPNIGDITATMPPILFPLGAGTAAVAYSANQESD